MMRPSVVSKNIYWIVLKMRANESNHTSSNSSILFSLSWPFGILELLSCVQVIWIPSDVSEPWRNVTILSQDTRTCSKCLWQTVQSHWRPFKRTNVLLDNILRMLFFFLQEVEMAKREINSPPQQTSSFHNTKFASLFLNFLVEGSLEVKLPTIWTVEKAEQRSRVRRWKSREEK